MEKKKWLSRRTQPLSYAVAVDYNLSVCWSTMGCPVFWILSPKFQFKHMFKKYFIRIPATFCRHLCSWSTPWFHILSVRRIWTLRYLSSSNRTFSRFFSKLPIHIFLSFDVVLVKLLSFQCSTLRLLMDGWNVDVHKSMVMSYVMIFVNSFE